MSGRFLKSCVALAVAAAVAAAPVVARRHDPEKMPETRIRDLHYGDVLFYFYQDDDFEAITRLTAYQHWNLLSHHEAEGQLLLGGLYLSLGMHNEAGERFQTLLNDDVPTGVRNRAWFYLAQIWYARGYLDKAADALRKINGRMSPELEAQREHLFANVLMHQGQFDEAIKLLSAARGSSIWRAYARFNLGVALVRKDRLADADQFLTSVGTMDATTPEMAALKDRANLALGFAYLQAKQPEKARTSLERVRLNGPYSNKALLGMGWADAALGDYKSALTPWMELRDRNLLDAAVQESYLAVPYAYSKLSANAQSADYYEKAVEQFSAEDGRLDGAIARIHDGKLLGEALSADKDGHYGWFWQLKDIPEAPESRYLYTLLAGHDFQEGLKNYRDLTFMSKTLDHWGENMDAFGDMIETRERAYAERLPRVDALLASGAVDKLQQRREELASRLNAIEKDSDVAALGSPEERDQWARIQRVEAALAGAPDTAENTELRDRLRLVKGVLYFRLNDSFKARMWQERRGIKDLDVALHEAQSRWIRVDRARKSVPTNTGEFANRVASLRQRIEALQTRLAAVEKKQEGYLAQLAIHELDQQKSRLAAYQVQARFALATMYDRAANESDTDKDKGKEKKDAAEGAPEAAPRGEAPKP
ncbi:MAG TPA: tetratricopeptide repeat protein [Steroidobacteraceae bacterium]|nr:tetratricopeptide repeat protein [Steroidobacteraceae bacterium]